MIALPVRAREVFAIREVAIATDDAAMVAACDGAARYLRRIAQGREPSAVDLAHATTILREIIRGREVSASLDASAAEGGGA